MKKCLLVFTSFLFLFTTRGFAQEALKSIEEEYYDFLSLSGVVERPTLGYRTLSDGVWAFNEIESFEENEDGTFTKVRVPGAESHNHIWKNNNLGTTYTLWSPDSPAENWFTRGIKQGLTARIYGPEWFNSYNTAAPYGQNDGALWQGRGYNTSLTAGLRLEGYGFELTFKPQVSFSQNKDFELINNSPYYTNKYAYIWGYGNNIGIDAPQRFGDTPFWAFDLGDSEIRWNWHSFTIGFGNQLPWIGFSFLNSILHSNNAPSYPKIDIGLRKTKIIIPFIDWYLGDIETRIWMGYLSESNYFDNDNTNNHNRINGFSFSFSPSIIPGLTFGFTKICLTKWNEFDIKFMNPFYSDNSGIGTSIGEDQKVAFYTDILFPKSGIELYGEFDIDDYFQGGWIQGLIRYPFDSSVWTIGLKKSINIIKTNNIYADIIIELSNMELPRNKISSKATYAYNMHYQITQGYTNKGQYLGTALANGGNSQCLMIDIYYSKGKCGLLFQRINPDNTYSYVNLANENQTYKGIMIIGVDNTIFMKSDFQLSTGFIYNWILNSLYFDKSNSTLGSKTIHNFRFTTTFCYKF